jgi:hypothetical protein
VRCDMALMQYDTGTKSCGLGLVVDSAGSGCSRYSGVDP